MDNYVDKLTPIQKGMKLSEVLTAERITAWQELFMHLLRGDNIIDTPKMFVTHTQGGVELDPVGKGGGGGGAPAVGCTKLKPILTKEDDKYMLEVTEGLFAAGFTSLPKTEITGATKIWGLLKILLVVEKSSSVVNLEDIYYYTGGMRTGAFEPGMGLGIEIILAEEDPTTFVNTPLTDDEDRRVDFAMLIGEITEETENGETDFKLKEIECGNKLFKFCPPESAFFINQ